MRAQVFHQNIERSSKAVSRHDDILKRPAGSIRRVATSKRVGEVLIHSFHLGLPSTKQIHGLQGTQSRQCQGVGCQTKTDKFDFKTWLGELTNHLPIEVQTRGQPLSVNPSRAAAQPSADAQWPGMTQFLSKDPGRTRQATKGSGTVMIGKDFGPISCGLP